MTIRHWLLYISDGEGKAVVTTDFPVGLGLGPDDRGAYAGQPVYEICAGTFLEFIWRFWTENEIWFASRSKRTPLTAAQADYLRHYAGT